MSLLNELLNLASTENTIGGLIIAGLATLLVVIVRAFLTNQGNVKVAKINSDTALGTAAIETLTTALKVLQEENKKLINQVARMDSEIDQLIELIICVIKSSDDEERMFNELERLESHLKSTNRWPYV